jgi:hypothetical protein
VHSAFRKPKNGDAGLTSLPMSPSLSRHVIYAAHVTYAARADLAVVHARAEYARVREAAGRRPAASIPPRAARTDDVSIFRHAEDPDEELPSRVLVSVQADEHQGGLPSCRTSSVGRPAPILICGALTTPSIRASITTTEPRRAGTSALLPQEQLR